MSVSVVITLYMKQSENSSSDINILGEGVIFAELLVFIFVCLFAVRQC